MRIYGIYKQKATYFAGEDSKDNFLVLLLIYLMTFINYKTLKYVQISNLQIMRLS